MFELNLIFSLIKRWYWLLLIGLFVGGGIGLYFTQTQPIRYRSNMRLLVSQPSANINGLTDPARNLYADTRFAEIYSELILSGAVIDQVSSVLEIGDANINVEADGAFMLLTVQSESRDLPPELLGLLAQTFIEFSESSQSSRYAESEETLALQLDQINLQIQQTENELGTLTQFGIQDQISETKTNLTELDAQIELLRQELNQIETSDLDNEISIIEKEAELQKFETQYAAYQAAYQAAVLDGVLTEQNNYLQLMEQSSASIVSIKSDILRLKETGLAEKELQMSLKTDDLNRLLTTRELYDALVNSSATGGLSELDTTQQVRIEQLRGNLDIYRRLANNLQTSYQNVRLTRLQDTANILIVDPPSPSSQVPQPSYLLIGAVMGFLLSGAIAFTLEYMDDTLKLPESAKQIYQAPVIGFVPETDQLAGESIYLMKHPRSITAEAFRNVRANLEFARVDQDLKTLLVSSANPGEGKTTISSSLAISLAQGGKRVLLVDVDLHRPRLHLSMGVNNYLGISDLFSSDISYEDVVQKTSLDGLMVMTSGSLPPNPSELLASQRMSTLLQTFSKDFDIVVLDTPPFVLSDPYVLASKVDGVLLAVQPNRTPHTAAHAIWENLIRADANIIGIVMSRISDKNSASPYYSYSSYGYAQSVYHDDPQGKAKPVRAKSWLSWVTGIFS